MDAQTVGQAHLFAISPGDGCLYRVLFGRLPAHTPDTPAFVLFGFGEGPRALRTILTQYDDLTPEDFARRWEDPPHPGSGTAQERSHAYAVFAALVGILGVPTPTGWEPTWREQIPIAVRG